MPRPRRSRSFPFRPLRPPDHVRPPFSPAAARRAAGRRGVTLVEVLMSVLVMGIGVVSVATLFPLAVLRGARGHAVDGGDDRQTERGTDDPVSPAPRR